MHTAIDLAKSKVCVFQWISMESEKKSECVVKPKQRSKRGCKAPILLFIRKEL